MYTCSAKNNNKGSKVKLPSYAVRSAITATVELLDKTMND